MKSKVLTCHAFSEHILCLILCLWLFGILDAYGHGNDNRYYQIGFIPAAPFTAMGSLTLRF